MSEFTISYEVAAVSEFDAIKQAVMMLRTGVRLRRVEGSVVIGRGFWKITLRVSE